MANRSESCVSATLRDYIPEKKQGQDNDRKSKKSNGKRSARSGLRRERTEDLLKRQQIERQEQQYRNWQSAKEEFRDEKQEQLSHKVALQKELIRAQDELYKYQREQEEQEAAKKREAAKLKRQAQEEALMKICRESLDEDRKQRLEQRAEKKKNASSALITTGNDHTSSRDLYATHARQNVPLEGYGLRLRRVSSFRKQNVDLREEAEGEDSDGDVPPGGAVSDEELDNLPWHQAQLYQLYGRKNAERFLRPKLEPKVVRPLNPKLRRQGGRAGASALWLTLRDDSRKKLLRQDASIPEELKLAYSAFVRQLLAKKKKPVKRNYFCKEDVPEMSRLLDQSLLINVQDLRHKHALMYRSSRTNQDRTGVLVHNNPMPDFNNWSGGESVERYMPSWLDDESEAPTEHSYQKWLSPRRHSLPPPAILEDVEDDDYDAKLDETIEDWHFLTSAPVRHEKQSKPKILFLTEAEARCAGQFSQRHLEEREARHLPRGHLREETKAQSALEGMESDRVDLVSGLSCESAPAKTQTRPVRRESYASEWQPLSMNALVEYKKSKGTQGDGDFRQGKHRMYAVKS